MDDPGYAIPGERPQPAADRDHEEDGRLRSPAEASTPRPGARGVHHFLVGLVRHHRSCRRIALVGTISPAGRFYGESHRRHAAYRESAAVLAAVNPEAARRGSRFDTA